SGPRRVAQQPRAGRPVRAPDRRTDNKLTPTQARVAVAGSLLRQLHAVLTTGTAWDPAIAGGLSRHPLPCDYSKYSSYSLHRT
ncbi:MAG: hypothetical protein WCA29_01800, partial [Jiangellales bacterium]